MSTTETNTNECKAFKVELLELREGEWVVCDTSLAMTNIPKSMVDHGEYWDVDSSDSVNLFTEDNQYIVEDFSDAVGNVCASLSIIDDKKPDSLNIGEWVEYYERQQPVGRSAILRYLSSRVIKGIGPKTTSLLNKEPENTINRTENLYKFILNDRIIFCNERKKLI